MAMDTITFNIDKRLKTEFQVAVIKNGTDMTRILLEAIKNYIKK